MTPYSKQNITNNEIKAVTKVLKSKFLTKGPLINFFEQKVAKKVNAKFAVSSNSGSSSLHLACLALNIKKGDLVWTVPNTYAASANCAINCGAKIDFVDINSETFNISVLELEKKLIQAKKKKKLPSVVIPVHFAGQPTDQKKIWKLSKKYRFKIIEDASHSLGAKHQKELVGSCRWSDITVFSFHPVKIITTGEGGMALTNNKEYARRMKMFRENGIDFDKKIKNCKKQFSWKYSQEESGYNYRMNEISAALGISQLSRLNSFLKKRNEIARWYQKKLLGTPVTYQKINKENYSSFHLFVIQFDLNKTKFNYKKIFEKFRRNNFFINLHYMPLHLSNYFLKLGFKVGQFPTSENYSKKSFSIPIYFDLKKKEMERVVNLIKEMF